MWFRILTTFVVVCFWAFTIALASHTSASGDVLSRYSNSYFVLLVSFVANSVVLTVFQFGSAYRWIYGRRHSLTLMSLSTIFSIALVELLIRTFDPIGISYYAHAAAYQGRKIADNELYYRHQPLMDEVFQGVSVQTNEVGFRDDPILDKEVNELRIMFLGDSVTFGWGVRQEDIFVRRVSLILEERLRRPVRAVNTGVGGYNTNNQDATLRRYGKILEPDVVVLMYVSNDIEPTPDGKFDPSRFESFSDKDPFQIVQMVIGHSWTYRLVSHVMRYRKATDKESFSTSSKGWIQSAEALQNISDYCESRGIPLIVLMYRMSPGQPEEDISQELSRLSLEMNFHFGDSLLWFVDKDIRQLINTPVDSHPNAQGHAILADGIVELLQKSVFSSLEQTR